MTIFARLPIQLVARALEDFKRNTPPDELPIMQVESLAKLLKVEFSNKYVGHITVLNDDVHSNRVGFVYVEPEYRRLGIASGLYYAAALVLAESNKVLVSDRFLNEGSSGVWMKICRYFPNSFSEDQEGRFILIFAIKEDY